MAVTRPVRKFLILLGLVLVCTAAGGTVLALRFRHIDDFTRSWVVRALGERYDSQVELDSLHVEVWPLMRVEGRGLTVHFHNHPELPPFLRVARFTFNAGLPGLFGPVKHISRIAVNDMVITIPPRERKDPTETPAPAAHRQLDLPVFVDKIVCDQTSLVFISRKPGKDPLDFEIHDLLLEDVGVDQPFTFDGNLTNAKPKGEIATQGRFGPWDLDHPGNSPVAGNYKFSDADLDPLPGIGGILSSTGNYDGPLDSLAVRGQTDTPNFSIDPVGRGVPLHTDFSATVNGTDGDTFLHPVQAVLGKSAITAKGSVVLVRAKQGHLIHLEVDAPAARLEDLLSLGMKADKPVMTGTVKLHTLLMIPPSKDKAVDKLVLDGDFDADDARFTSATVRERLQSLSRHGMGEPADPQAGSALSDLKGHFHVENATLTFTHLNFSVEGAAVTLDGSYKLHGGELDFHGNLRLEATVSQMLTGWKSTLAKPFDPLFRKNGAGTLLPITITGTRENPVFGATLFHKTFKKELHPQKPKS